MPRPAGYPAAGVAPTGSPYPPLTTVQGTPVGPHHPAAAPAGYIPATSPPVGTGYTAAATGHPGYALNTTGAGDQDSSKAGPLACVAIVLFILGIFFPFLWVVVAFLPWCARGQSLKTQLLLRRIAISATIALVVYAVLAIVFGVLGGTRWNRGGGGGYYGAGGGNTGRLCRDASGNTFYC